VEEAHAVETQRLLVIDDDPGVTSLLRRGLSYEGFAVDTAPSGTAGLNLAREHYPDLVILDIMMPGMDGMEVLRRLRAADERLPILMLTGKDAPSDQISGLESGADDYMLKPFSLDVLLAHVRSLLRRQEAERPAVLRFSDLSLDAGTRRAWRGTRPVDLTGTEYDLLRQFLEHPRQVLSKEALMQRVWGFEFHRDDNIVEVYVKQLRQKLEAEGESRLIHTLRGAGYVLREE
jgi:DNA-binding response OmpR family regulator